MTGHATDPSAAPAPPAGLDPDRHPLAEWASPAVLKENVMGTRADFYIGRGTEAEWLGSIAWDGDYTTVLPELGPILTEEGWRDAIQRYLATQDDGTTPDQGWPWPWKDSQTTDFAYTWDDGQLWWTCYGHGWVSAAESLADGFDYDVWEDQHAGESRTDFPDMTARQNVTLGPRSGVIVFGLGGTP